MKARRSRIVAAHTTKHTMATKLEKALKRELEFEGKLYTVTISPDGIKVTEKGKRKGNELSWAAIITGDAILTQDLKLSLDAARGSAARA